jgi:hypothetical protein
MKTRFVKLLVFISVVGTLAALSVLAQQPRSSQRSGGGDFRITEKTTVGGRSFESTTMIKGPRERSESNMGMGMSTVSVTQCDLKQTIQINDRARKYLVTPMDNGDGAETANTAGAASSTPSGSSGPTRGGVVTYTITSTDTGERKEMFGFTARHLKSSMSMEPSPDACSKQTMRIDRDGWYIDLSYDFSCGFERPPQTNMMGGGARECQDRVRFRRSGSAKLGFPALETTTIYGSDGSVMTTMTKEVVDLSRQPLDAALFDVPAGYTQAQSKQEMYSAPSRAEIMAMAQQQQTGRRNEEPSGEAARPNLPGADVPSKPSGRVRVGVVEINNKANASISTDGLRDRLIGEISGTGVDSIPLDASSIGEAQTEAKAKQCDYILFTDISSLKAASASKKIGGLLGRATGVDTGGTGKSEARLDFKLFPAGGSSAKLESSAVGKEDSDDASVSAALDREAKAVVAAARPELRDIKR